MDKVLGLSEAKVQELVNKYGCVICKQDFVPVVSVEEFKKMKLDLLMNIHTLEAVISITKDEAVRLQAKAVEEKE